MNTSVSDTIRVLHLCEHFGNRSASFHGVARSFELWLPKLQDSGLHALLCSRAKPNQAALDRYRAVGIEPFSLGYGKFDPRNLWRLIQLIRREKIDILHLHGYGACTWGRIAGHMLGVPAIVHERCNYGTVPWFQRPVEWILGPLTRYAFAVSESTRRFTVEKRHIPDTVVRLLYSGIPLDDVLLLDDAARQVVRSGHGISSDKYLLGVVGRLESHKGHMDVLEALVTLRKQVPNVRLWIVGDGSFQGALEVRTRDLGLTDVVEFLGYQSDVLRIIQALDLQVFPSHQEGTPNTLYEAMAVGNLIIASTADGQGEVLEDHVHAVLYEPGDVKALAQGIQLLHGDSELCTKLREAARSHIKDYDINKSLEVLKSTYFEIGRKE